MKICCSKKCSHKGVMQTTTNFYKKPMTKDGLTEECKDCIKERQLKWNKKKKESYNDFFKLIIG